MNKKLLLALTLSLTALQAQAEDMYRGAWYALPTINYTNTDNDIHSENGYGGGLRFGKEINQDFDVQIGLTHGSFNENTLTSTGGNFQQTLLSAEALHFFSRDKLRPFLLAGVGLANNHVNYKNAQFGGNNTSLMADLGAGVQYLFNDNIGIQADVKQVWSDVNNGTNKSIQDNTVFSLGAIYRFGKPTPAKIEVAEKTPATIIAEPKPAVVTMDSTCEDKTITLNLMADELFVFGKDTLSNRPHESLDNIVAQLNNSDKEIEVILITGYTDLIGSNKSNQTLSENRANTVKKYLVAQGVSEDLITTEGKGEGNPVVECNHTKNKTSLISCLSPNRRVIVSSTVKETVKCGH